jgi:hypothetical protein
MDIIQDIIDGMDVAEAVTHYIERGRMAFGKQLRNWQLGQPLPRGASPITKRVPVSSIDLEDMPPIPKVPQRVRQQDPMFFDRRRKFSEAVDRRSPDEIPWYQRQYIVQKSFRLGYGSSVRNPNPSSYKTHHPGAILTHSGAGDAGRVWFTDSTGERGVIHAGELDTMIKNGMIKRYK